MADIISSKKLISTIHGLNQLNRSLKQINNHFLDSLIINFEIVAGDSFGAVVEKSSAALDIIFHLQRELFPMQARMCVVKGEILSVKNVKKFNEINGEPLWKANELLKELKKNGLLFASDFGEDYLTISTNCICNLVLQQRLAWSEDIWKINEYKNDGCTQKEIGQHLNLSQQYISTIIRKKNIVFLNKVQHDIINALKNMENLSYV